MTGLNSLLDSSELKNDIPSKIHIIHVKKAKLFCISDSQYGRTPQKIMETCEPHPEIKEDS